MKYDVIVIGGGAAGLMCAIEAGKRGRSVAVIDHSERLGKKILISGGGRCNFTNINAGPRNYISQNPNFCKSALARYTPNDFIALVEKHGIAYHEKKLGQLFCDFSSKQIVEMLEAELKAVHGEIRLNCKVNELTRNEDFRLQTNQGDFVCDSVVIATGGLSFPKIGATDFGYRIAKQFGINLVQTRPGLVPLTFQSEEQSSFGQLSGISVDALASAEGISFRENLLFTHRGLSGPSILQVSSYRTESGPIELNLLPDVDVKKWLLANRQANKELKTLMTEYLPQRLTNEWCSSFTASKPMHRYSNVELDQVADRLQHWKINPAGTEGYAKAEVTLGGVDTSELSSKTMESRKVPGLYFIGEVVDVTGWLGGYNFQWAWASGHAAGQFV